LIIGPEGGVANTVVYIKKIASGKDFDLPSTRRFLDQKRCRYEPHILLVPAGGTLDMKSSDSAHDSHGRRGELQPDLSVSQPGHLVPWHLRGWFT